MLTDPHGHKRETQESCLTCRFFFPTPKGNHGDCRRFPPTGTDNGHPSTYPGGWCGEFKKDAHRIDAPKNPDSKP